MSGPMPPLLVVHCGKIFTTTLQESIYTPTVRCRRAMPHDLNYVSYSWKAVYYKNQERNRIVDSENKELASRLRSTSTMWTRPAVEMTPSYSFKAAFWKSRDKTKVLLVENSQLKRMVREATEGYQ